MVKCLDLKKSEDPTSGPVSTLTIYVNLGKSHSTSLTHFLIEGRVVVKKVCVSALKSKKKLSIV